MIKNRPINLSSLAPEVYLTLSVVVVLLAAVIYTSMGLPLVDRDSQRSLSAASSSDYWAADAARWEALAEYYLANKAPALTRAQAAEAARLESLAEYYLAIKAPALTRAQAAEADRLEALAEYYLANKVPGLTRAQAADAARWNALADFYLKNKAPALTPALAAEAARLTALSIFYGVEPANISPQVSSLLGR